MKRLFILCMALALASCASVTKTVTGPGGYKYTEKIMAIGGGNIDKATQSFGGTLKAYNPDGTMAIEVTLDSDQISEGTTSDAEILKGVLALVSRLTIP